MMSNEEWSHDEEFEIRMKKQKNKKQRKMKYAADLGPDNILQLVVSHGQGPNWWSCKFAVHLCNNRAQWATACNCNGIANKEA